MLADQLFELQRLKMSAAMGHATSQYELAMRYAHGLGVKANAYNSVYWLKQAARLDHAPAQYELAANLLMGIGTMQDKSAGRYWLQRAAKSEHTPAQTMLGLLQYFGWGVQPDQASALMMLNKAAGKNDPRAFEILKTIKSIPADKVSQCELEEKFFSVLSGFSKIHAATNSFYPQPSHF